MLTELNDLTEDSDVRCSAAGVLVNVCGAGAGGASGVDSAASVAAHALETAAVQGDAPTAALLARALWNALAHAPLPHGRAQQAASALAYFLDDDSVFEAACEAPAPAASGRRGGPQSDNPSSYMFEKHHVKFEDEAGAELADRNLPKPYSARHELGPVETPGGDGEGNGEDLGFEEGDLPGEDGYVLGEDGCECAPCRRLAAWEELVGVAIPLMDKLIPKRADASVGTD
ncbi:hypothetical protein EVAR_20323_1 [Eumeta japonica]|uniref:Uncharacterized protein n=1 Tax=Eumeta variegata TaxID=151549 RepID=A0A4C1VQZ0_EUMVA|nr:hypothetical protein EVAR_20323_1 [Eumeta japonica]